MAISEAVVIEHGLEVPCLCVDRVGVVLDDGGGDASGVVQNINLVLLVDERVVVVALGALDVALAGVLFIERLAMIATRTAEIRLPY